MLSRLISLLLLASSLYAETPKVTKATGSIIQQKGKIQTGPSSRIELEFPQFAIMRIGSNANVKFSNDARDVILDSGTLIFSSPKNSGEVSIKSGGVVTMMNGGDLEMANVRGQIKVIVLNGKAFAQLASASNPKSTKLTYGRMIDVPPGATSMPRPTTVNLKTLIATSTLMKMGTLPSQKTIERNANNQVRQPTFRLGQLGEDGGDPSMGIASQAQTTLQIETIQTKQLQQEQIAADQLAAQQLAKQQLAQQQQAQAAAAAQLVAEQQAKQLAEQTAAAAAEATTNQGKGPQGNQGQGPQGNQGQGNQGQGNQGQGKPPHLPPGQNKPPVPTQLPK